MGEKVRVPRHGKAQGYVVVESNATVGATVGKNLYHADGTLVTEAELAAAAAASTPGSSVARTLWELIQKIPAAVRALAAMTGTGLFAITGSGTGAVRTIQPTAGRTTVSNGDGVAGDPVVDLAVVPDAGTGTALKKILRDSYGRVAATEDASASDVSYDNTASGLAAADVQAAIDEESARVSTQEQRGTSVNTLVNSSFAANMDGWALRGESVAVPYTIRRSDGSLAGDANKYLPPGLWGLEINAVGYAPASGTLIDVHTEDFFDVSPDEKIMASVYFNAFRCNVWAYLAFQDASGADVGYSSTLSAPANAIINPASLSALTRYSTEAAAAPANTVRARLVLRMLSTGEGSPYIWYTKPMRERCSPTQTQPSTYNNVGFTSLHYRRDDLTATAGDNTITLNKAPSESALTIHKNGLLLAQSAYTLAGTAVTLASSAAGGDVFSVAYWSEEVATASTIGAVDAYFANVIALLHGDGTDGSTTFTDQTGRIWTPNGNVQIDTAQSKFGGSAILFDGSGDYLTCNDAAYSNFDTSTQWTLETWLRSDLAANVALFHIKDSGTSYFQCMAESTGLRINIFGVNILNQGNSNGLATNTWMHIAFVRDGANLYGFVDGVLRASSTSGASIPALASQQMFLGINTGMNFSLNGHMEDIRITKGVARYTASFTPPSAPFPNN